MIIRDTYNGNEILRKYNKKGDTYKMYRVYKYIYVTFHVKWPLSLSKN